MGFETMNKVNKNQETRREFSVPESEYEFSFARSGGKGGQNVNKRDTKAVLRWYFRDSKKLSDEQKTFIAEYAPLANKISKNDGAVVLYEQSQREQGRNKEILKEKLNRLVNEALTPQTERVATKVPRSSREARIQKKKTIGEKKSGRGKVREWE